MRLPVFLPDPWDPDALDRLRAGLDADVVLHLGPAIPDPPDYRILVSGRPSPRALEKGAALEILVIPWAGVPAGLPELLADYPRVAVHNLHHNAVPVAETAVALLLAAAKRIVLYDRTLRKNDWRPRYEEKASFLLQGKKALVLGYGAVGRALCRMLCGFGMEVTALRRTGAAGRDGDVELRPAEDLGDLLPRAEVLLVCLPATARTEGMLGEAELDRLPPGALLVNVGRGKILQEEALFRALEQGRLFAAGLDVWYRYPKKREEAGDTAPSAFPFHTLENVVMSPHRAGHVREDPALRADHLAVLLNAAARGAPLPNPVDLERGY